MTATLILVATNNPGKLAEYRDLLCHVPQRAVSPAEMGLMLEVDEDGVTFQENAIKKARAFAHASGLLTLADDSGLEVDALDGGPGVYSSRYGASDEERLQRLLRALGGIPSEQRTARFRCVIALTWPNGPTETYEGTVEGVVGQKPQGNGGFGYDSVFLLPKHGLTMAQLAPDEKNAVSHRGQAARRAADRLCSLYNSAYGILAPEMSGRDSGYQ